MRVIAPLIALLLVSFSFAVGSLATPVFEDTAPLTTAEGLGIGSRYIGMGGAGVAVVDDAASLYWNPAGLSYGEGNELELDAFGDVNDVDLLSKLRHGISILRRGSSNLSSEDVDDLIGIAQDANGKPLEANAGAIAALRIHHFALGAWGRGTGDFQFDWNGSLTAPEINAGGIPGDNDISAASVRPSDGVLPPALVAWAINAGAGWARKWTDKIRAGLVLRQQLIDIREATAQVHTIGGVTSGSVSEILSEHAQKYTGDLGFIFTPEENIRLGLVARNLAAPDYHLGNGIVLDVPTSRSVDVGFAAWSQDHRTIVAGDVHNLTAADGGKGSFHLGIEHRFGDMFTLRAGTATGNSFCWGFDFAPFKAWVLRAASSTSLGEQLGLGMALRF